MVRKDLPKHPSYAMACAYFALNRRFAGERDHIRSWGFFKLLEFREGYMRIQNSRTLLIHELEFESSIKANGGIEFHISNKTLSKQVKIGLGTASESTLQNIVGWVEDRLSENISEKFIDSLAQNISLYLMLIATNRSLVKDTIFIENSGACLKSIKSLVLDQPDMDFEKRLARIDQLCYFIMIKGRPVDIQDITDAFSRRFRRSAVDFLYSIDERRCWEVLSLLRVAREHGLKPDITNLQNTIYAYIQDPSSPISEDLRLALRQQLNFR